MSDIILIAFAVVFLSLLFANWAFKKRRYEKYLEKVPGPKPHPIFGNALDLIGTDRLIIALKNYRDTYGGKLTKISIGPSRALLIAYDHDFLELVFTSDKMINKSTDYEHLHRWLGLGLLNSSGEKWQQRRKMITPTFHFQILNEFIQVFNSAGDIFVERLKKLPEDVTFDVHPYVALCALDVICESAMGIEVNAQLDEDSDYVRSVKEMGRILMERAAHPFKQYDWFYYFSKDYKKELKAVEILHNLTDSVIQKRRDELMKNNNQKAQNGKVNGNRNNTAHYDDFGRKKRHAFLDMLLQATTSDGKCLSNADIREEVDTFMFEGHDTTSSAIAFSLLMLSKYPQIQTKVFEEVRSILGDDKNTAPTYRNLQDMKYLKMVINEVLRMFPSVPVLAREISEDVEFEGHTLPKGLTVLIPIITMHRDPRYFPEPDKFDPERFSSANKIGRKPFSYFPFSAGPRNCIGQKFAMLELKSTLSKIVRHFELAEAPDFEPILAAETITKSKNGVCVQIRQRGY